MTAADRERILDRLAHSLPNGGEERIVSLSRADVEWLRELVERDRKRVPYFVNVGSPQVEGAPDAP
jgi:hypothetical protein